VVANDELLPKTQKNAFRFVKSSKKTFHTLGNFILDCIGKELYHCRAYLALRQWRRQEVRCPTPL